MATVKVTVHGINQSGTCSLSGKEGIEVLNVTIEPDNAPVSLTPKAFLSLLKMKCGQDAKPANGSPGPVARPQPVPAAAPMAAANQVK